MKKTTTRLADGRELIYYDSRDDAGPRRRRPPPARRRRHRLRDPPRPAPRRHGSPSPPTARAAPTTRRPTSARCAPPATDGCTEIPADDYDVVVFENRFPSLTGGPGPTTGDPADLLARRPGAGRCEVVCFTSDHDASFADLTPGQAAPRPRRLDRPHRRPVPTPRRRAGLLLREPRRARSASPSTTRTARSTPTPSSPPAPTHDAASARRAPASAPAATSSTTSSPPSATTATRIVARRRALDRLRPVRRPLAVRGPPLPPPPGPRPARPRRRRARRVPPPLPRTPAPLRPHLRHRRAPHPVHRRLAPGARPRTGSGTSSACTWSSSPSAAPPAS